MITQQYTANEYLESLRSTRGYLSKPESLGLMTNALNLSSCEPLTTDETTAVSAVTTTTTTSAANQVALTNGNHSSQSNSHSNHVNSSSKLNSSQRERQESESYSSESSTESEEPDKNSKIQATKADLEFKLLVKSSSITEPNGKNNGILKNLETPLKNTSSPLLASNNREKYLNEQNRNSPYKSSPFKQEIIITQQIQQHQSSSFSSSTSLSLKCSKKNSISKKFHLKQNWPYVMILTAVLISIVYQYVAPTSSITTSNHTDDLAAAPNDALSLAKQKAYLTKFNEHMKFIKSKYPNQTRLFWANIESTYRHSIVKTRDPSIILIVSDKLTSHTGHELASDILNAIKTSIEDQQSSNLNNLVISPAEYSNFIESKQFDQVKLIIDNKLNRIFQSGQRVALVRSIQQIPATSMLLFYTYGDDLLSAKYPGVVILMTLEIDDILLVEQRAQLANNSKKIMEFVETYLFQMWSKFVGEDQLKPLFTRIGNNVVFVNNESK